ncbi:hypothetical protein ACFL0V_03875 [Nanoarchaeota archaeon]
MNKTILLLPILLLSILSVSAYTVDLTTYPLIIQDLKLTGENQIQFSLYNPSNADFDLKNLKSLETSFDNTKTINQFVQYSGDAFSVIGKLNAGQSQQFIVPFDRLGTSNTKLRCKKPIELKIFMHNGNMISHWTGIPKCEIQGKRPCGLLKIDETAAEFFDEEANLKILWELIDANSNQGQVLLMKSIGRQTPSLQWLSTGDCPDIESGKCMTELTDITFTSEGVSLTLKDNRKDRLATLTRTYTPQTTYTYQQTHVQPQATAQASVQQFKAPAENTATQKAATQMGLVTADTHDPVCATTCKANNRCYDTGDRAIYINNYVFCKNGWQIQKPEGFHCQDSYECQTELCYNNKCVLELPQEPEQKSSAITRFLEWIDDLL